jgi:hypothetical protein
MDIISTAIISLVVVVAYDLFGRKLIFPWVQSWFKKDEPPTPPTV